MKNVGGPTLTYAELVVACNNIGFDISCGRCAAIFYTGSGTNIEHDDTCKTRESGTKTADYISRKKLWLDHGCPVGHLYGDDGNMQCSHCFVDFKNDDWKRIKDRLMRVGHAK